MKIPKYVEELINRRRKLALQLQDVSSQLDNWLMEHQVPCGTDYTLTGCMIYCEPDTAAECVRRDILEK